MEKNTTPQRRVWLLGKLFSNNSVSSHHQWWQYSDTQRHRLSSHPKHRTLWMLGFAGVWQYSPPIQIKTYQERCLHSNSKNICWRQAEVSILTKTLKNHTNGSSILPRSFFSPSTSSWEGRSALWQAAPRHRPETPSSFKTSPQNKQQRWALNPKSIGFFKLLYADRATHGLPIFFENNWWTSFRFAQLSHPSPQAKSYCPVQICAELYQKEGSALLGGWLFNMGRKEKGYSFDRHWKRFLCPPASLGGSSLLLWLGVEEKTCWEQRSNKLDWDHQAVCLVSGNFTRKIQFFCLIITNWGKVVLGYTGLYLWEGETACMMPQLHFNFLWAGRTEY